MQNHFFAVLVVLPALANLAACAEKPVVHSLELKDESGTLVAALAVALPSPLPPSSQQFEGSWQLKSHTSAFPIGSVQVGKYRGSQSDGQLLLDLNPGWADNNVVLEVPAPMKQLQGRWCLATFAGCHPRGTFGPAR